MKTIVESVDENENNRNGSGNVGTTTAISTNDKANTNANTIVESIDENENNHNGSGNVGTTTAISANNKANANANNVDKRAVDTNANANVVNPMDNQYYFETTTEVAFTPENKGMMWRLQGNAIAVLVHKSSNSTKITDLFRALTINQQYLTNPVVHFLAIFLLIRSTPT
jgi:hypothetical protein